MPRVTTTESFQERALTAVEAVNTAVLSLAQGEQAGAYAATYSFVGADWGATFTEIFNTPSDKRGALLSMDLYQITEEFSGDSTAATVQVGTAADADAYATAVSIPDTTAVAAALNLVVTAGAVAIIPAGSAVTVTGTISVDAGAKEGIGTLSLTVLYFT